MTDEEFQIVKMWANEILTEKHKLTASNEERHHFAASQSSPGGTDKKLDQRPVLLLNSLYQLLYYVINERLKKIVEPANILEPGQGGGRQGRCIGIDMQKVHFI